MEDKILKDKIKFVVEYPTQYTMLQCLRKSLILDKDFKLSVQRVFFLNMKEYLFFGHRIESLGFGKVTPNDVGHFKVVFSKETVIRLKLLVSKIEFK